MHMAAACGGGAPWEERCHLMSSDIRALPMPLALPSPSPTASAPWQRPGSARPAPATSMRPAPYLVHFEGLVLVRLAHPCPLPACSMQSAPHTHRLRTMQGSWGRGSARGQWISHWEMHAHLAGKAVHGNGLPNTGTQPCQLGAVSRMRQGSFCHACLRRTHTMRGAVVCGGREGMPVHTMHRRLCMCSTVPSPDVGWAAHGLPAILGGTHTQQLGKAPAGPAWRRDSPLGHMPADGHSSGNKKAQARWIVAISSTIPRRLCDASQVAAARRTVRHEAWPSSCKSVASSALTDGWEGRVEGEVYADEHVHADHDKRHVAPARRQRFAVHI